MSTQGALVKELVSQAYMYIHVCHNELLLAFMLTKNHLMCLNYFIMLCL